ncbi:hypothetical protein WJD69_22180, partial [Salmonella enterica subsp. enterica serovar Corvallis]
RWMPNHDRFECQTAIDSDAILQTEYKAPAFSASSIFLYWALKMAMVEISRLCMSQSLLIKKKPP